MIDLTTIATRAITWAISNPDEAAAMATGILGAALLASRSRHAGHGWILFLASNAGWLWFAWRKDHPGLFTCQVIFTITSLIGIWNWLLANRWQRVRYHYATARKHRGRWRAACIAWDLRTL